MSSEEPKSNDEPMATSDQEDTETTTETVPPGTTVDTAATSTTETETETETTDKPNSDKDEEEEEDSNSNSESEDTNDDEEETKNKDPTSLIIQAVTHKDEGNAFFKSNDLTKASRSYRRGTTLLKPLNFAESSPSNDPNKNLGTDDATDEQVKSLLLSLQTNLSMVCYKQKKYKQSVDVASKALQVDPTNVKARYRRAVAYKQIGNYEDALQDLRKALETEEGKKNKEVRKEFVSVKKVVEKRRERQKAGLKKAFSEKKGSGGESFLYDDKDEEERLKLEARKKKQEEEKVAREKRKVQWEEECVHRMSRGEDAITYEDWDKERKKKEQEEENKRKKLKKEEEEREERKRKEEIQKRNLERRKNQVDSESDEDDELTERELQMLRGYKKTSDGRTTSYFNREQTEEEKKLLGNIAPQRLDSNSSSTSIGATATNVSTSTATSPDAAMSGSIPTPSSSSPTAAAANIPASAWNRAGTWEERDTSDWCHSSLTSHLKQSKVETITMYKGRVKKVDDLKGDASVAFVSGKKRYVFDYHAKLKYEITVTRKKDDGEDDVEVVASGKLQLPDISSTAISDELEVDILSHKNNAGDDDDYDVCMDEVMKCREELVQKVRSQVLMFVAAFNAQY